MKNKNSNPRIQLFFKGLIKLCDILHSKTKTKLSSIVKPSNMEEIANIEDMVETLLMNLDNKYDDHLKKLLEEKHKIQNKIIHDAIQHFVVPIYSDIFKQKINDKQFMHEMNKSTQMTQLINKNISVTNNDNIISNQNNNQLSNIKPNVTMVHISNINTNHIMGMHKNIQSNNNNAKPMDVDNIITSNQSIVCKQFVFFISMYFRIYKLFRIHN